jgi:hypothetical protein
MGKFSSAEALGRDACKVEIEFCKEPIGKQDQYAAAFGGFNLIEFRPDESVVVSPLICKAATIQSLQASLLMFYTGTTRNASTILQEQSDSLASSPVKQQALRRMVELTYILRDELQANNLAAMGEAAAAGATDYKALVCVFLYGGNDYGNTLIPVDAVSYTAYHGMRPTLAYSAASLVPTTLAPSVALHARELGVACVAVNRMANPLIGPARLLDALRKIELVGRGRLLADQDLSISATVFALAELDFALSCGRARGFARFMRYTSHGRFAF